MSVKYTDPLAFLKNILFSLIPTTVASSPSCLLTRVEFSRTSLSCPEEIRFGSPFGSSMACFNMDAVPIESRIESDAFPIGISMEVMDSL